MTVVRGIALKTHKSKPWHLMWCFPERGGGVSGTDGEQSAGRKRKKKKGKRDTGPEITRLTGDNLNFLLEDVLSFPPLLWFPFPRSINCSFRYTRRRSLCVCADMTDGVSNTSHALFLVCFSNTHTQKQWYSLSSKDILLSWFVFQSHTPSCLVGKVSENKNSLWRDWLQDLWCYTM